MVWEIEFTDEFAGWAQRQKYFKLPLFFIVTNAATAVAWVKYFGGTRSVRWDPSKR